MARGHTALLYVFQGEVAVGGTGATGGRLIPATRLVVLTDGDVVHALAGSAPARFLLLSAQPLDEPAVRWGPFVMNTREEIDLARRELRDGTFIKDST